MHCGRKLLGSSSPSIRMRASMWARVFHRQNQHHVLFASSMSPPSVSLWTPIPFKSITLTITYLPFHSDPTSWLIILAFSCNSFSSHLIHLFLRASAVALDSLPFISILRSISGSHSHLSNSNRIYPTPLASLFNPTHLRLASTLSHLHSMAIPLLMTDPAHDDLTACTFWLLSK